MKWLGIKEKLRRMSLRYKAWVVTLIILLSIVVLIGGGVDFFLIESFDRLEKKSIRNNAMRVKQLMASEAENLRRITQDYAVWTETYDFMSTGSRSYLVSNFSPDVLQNLQLDGVFLFNNRGERTAAYMLDPSGNSFSPEKSWDEVMMEIIKSSSGGVKTGHEGIWVIHERPYIYTCLEIHRDGGRGASAGYFIHLRAIDALVTERVSEILQLDVSISLIDPAGTAGVPPDEKNGNYFITDKTRDRLDINVVLKNPHDEPAVVFKVAFLRDINREGRRAIFLFHIVFAAMLIAAGLLIERFLRLLVISRLEQITEGLNDIGDSLDLSSRLPARDGDELDDLAREINRMLDSLELVENERWVMQENLLHARKLEAVGTMAGGIAHDFNNMLASILGSAELIKIDSREGLSIDEHLRRIEEAGQKAVGLVKQLLALNRGQAGDRSDVSLMKDLSETIRFISSTLPDNIEVKLTSRVENDRVSIDQAQLQRVVINMINNAVHAMAGKDQGQILISIEEVVLPDDNAAVETAHLVPGRYLKIVVADQGRGIPKEVIDRIFEPFFSTKPTGSGTGLGLTIASKFAEQHAGSIGVTSEPGKGTEFRIHIPAESNTITRPHYIEGGKEQLLLVDDDTLVRNTLAEGLRRMGYRVFTAASAQSALTIIGSEEAEPDIVITDQIMPGMTGLDLRRKIAGIRPELPVILLSGYTTMPDETEAREESFARILMKPITIEQLALAVRETVSLKRKRL